MTFLLLAVDLPLVPGVHEVWYVEIGIAAALVTSIGVLVQKVGKPAYRALRAAVRAAPEIVVGVEALNELVRTDVVGRLDQAAEVVEAHSKRLDLHESRLDGHDQAIAVHDEALAALMRAPE